jgi:predicted nucleic acid-binding protein
MIENSFILLDSCIINYLSSKDDVFSENINILIQNLINRNNQLCVSQFTYYEVLRGASDSKKIKIKEDLKKFIVIGHSVARQSRAIKLYSAYKQVPEVCKHMNSISDIDIFIGSLIFTDKQPLLLTGDYNDFPRPFFREVDVFMLERKSGKREVCYFLEGDLELFLES